jgi:hypothetical protein
MHGVAGWFGAEHRLVSERFVGRQDYSLYENEVGTSDSGESDFGLRCRSSPIDADSIGPS